MLRRALGMVLAGCVACTATPTQGTDASGAATGVPSPAATPLRVPGATTSSAASSAAAVAPTPAPPQPSDDSGPQPVTKERALELMFGAGPTATATACLEQARDEAIRCLLALQFDGDERAREIALRLYDNEGIVSGVEREYVMDGGWRGSIKIVPERPIGPHRRHLEWIAEATGEFRSFFDQLGKTQADAGPWGYRYQPIELKFFRSVGRTTPSAYASAWSIGFNVKGSLHGSAEAVRETMFHEIFHLNDQAHGRWSGKALTAIYDRIVKRCTKHGRLSTPCLRPFAPNDTMVRGGTFYAFQPGNGVWEYSAELAIRYYREHSAILAGRRLTKKPFKCGPELNGSSWKLLADEFFAGIDLVPPCE